MPKAFRNDLEQPWKRVEGGLQGEGKINHLLFVSFSSLLHASLLRASNHLH
jgi:hypothetical protein